MPNPMGDKKERHVPGGRRVDTYDHGLSRRSSRAKPPTRYELGWKVEVMIKKIIIIVIRTPHKPQNHLSPRYSVLITTTGDHST